MRQGEEEDHAPPGENFDGWKNGEQRRGWRRLDSRCEKPIVLLMLMFALWSIFFMGGTTVDAQSLNKTQLAELITFLKEHNPTYTNFSYDQLKQWFEDQTPANLKFEEYPRLYPFCVTHALIVDGQRTKPEDHLYKFKDIFRSMEKVDERFYNFDKMEHSTKFRKDWVTSIDLSRINTPDMDMVNLRQWLHIKVTFPMKVKGLYMQSIVGPMGLPFGEFYLDFPCQDDGETANMKEIGQLSYCAYRPRTTIQHPSAYVGYSEHGQTTFHAHFFWTDITCMETPYLQFLMLVVKDFSSTKLDSNNKTKIGRARLNREYKPLFSPIFLNTDFDSKSGAPFPYYPEWRNQMYCFLTNLTFNDTYKSLYPGVTDLVNDPLNPNRGRWPSPKQGADPFYDPIKWKEDNDTFRIQPNEAYDSCLTANKSNPAHKKRWERRNEDRLECPPGPFRCDTTYGGSSRDQVTKQREELVQQEHKVANCSPCGAPNCELIGFPDYKCDAAADELVTIHNETVELNNVETIIRGKSHGMQAIFAFLILVPLSNFLARFYKEVCGHFFCDNGPWIFVHIISHVLSIVFMWISLGPVLPKLSEIESVKKECHGLFPEPQNKTKYQYCVFRSSIGNAHNLLGLLAFLIQHCLVLFGFWHSAKPKIRAIQVILHSHFGYLCWLLGAIATIMGTYDAACKDVLVMTILLIVVPLVFSAIAVALDCMMDKKVGIIPPRKQWPILEGVKLEGRGPFTMPKWIVFGAFTGLMVLIWVIALGTTFQLVGSTENLFTTGNNTNPKLSSLFGDCAPGANLIGKGSKSYAAKKKDELEG